MKTIKLGNKTIKLNHMIDHSNWLRKEQEILTFTISTENVVIKYKKYGDFDRHIAEFYNSSIGKLYTNCIKYAKRVIPNEDLLEECRKFKEITEGE